MRVRRAALVTVVLTLIVTAAMPVSSEATRDALAPACDADSRRCGLPPAPDLECTNVACESYADLPADDAQATPPPTPSDVIPARCSTFTPTDPPVTGSPSLVMSKFLPLSPDRFFDTRREGDAGYLCPGQTITKQITGQVGLPSEGVVTAVAMNLTGTAAGGEGYVTVWPAGAARPYASSLNFTSAFETRSNLVIVPVGTNGQVNFYSSAGVHLIADVAGWFGRPVGATSPDGRLITVPPQRVLDTRLGIGVPASKPAPNSSFTMQIAGSGGVPASGAEAVVLNLTGTDATGPGFVTVWTTGLERPNASSLNLVRVGDTAPNLIIVPIPGSGQISFYTEAGAHLIADVFGWFTDGAQTDSAIGLFMPLNPTRIFDTRPSNFVGAGSTIIRANTGLAGIPSTGVAAVAVNLTATASAAPGFITAWPTGQTRPIVSTLNLTKTNDTRPNAAIVPVGTGGSVSYFVENGAHLLADAAGYFTAPP